MNKLNNQIPDLEIRTESASNIYTRRRKVVVSKYLSYLARRGDDHSTHIQLRTEEAFGSSFLKSMLLNCNTLAGFCNKKKTCDQGRGENYLRLVDGVMISDVAMQVLRECMT